MVKGLLLDDCSVIHAFRVSVSLVRVDIIWGNEIGWGRLLRDRNMRTFTGVEATNDTQGSFFISYGNLHCVSSLQPVRNRGNCLIILLSSIMG